MGLDLNVSRQAFQAGSGFSAAGVTDFILVLIGVMAIIWAIILLIGWFQAYKQQENPAEFLLLRLTFLLAFVTFLFALLGSS